LLALSFARYLTRGSDWRQEDYNAYKFVRAIKGRSISGYAWIPVGNLQRRLREINKDAALEWFAEMAAPALTGSQPVIDLPQPIALVPVPGSDCTIGSPSAGRTAVLATALAKRIPSAVVWDGLRWLNAKTPASQGGSRDPDVLLANLVALGYVPAATLLVDDVLTSGAHLRTAAAELASKGSKVYGAVCAGRTVHDQSEPAFGTFINELEPF